MNRRQLEREIDRATDARDLAFDEERAAHYALTSVGGCTEANAARYNAASEKYATLRQQASHLLAEWRCVYGDGFEPTDHRFI